MNTAKYTPAPWKVANTIDPAIANANGQVNYILLPYPGLEYDRIKADIQIMVASPELLEALEYALPFLEPVGTTNTIGVTAAAKKARAAIAKAKEVL